MTSHTQKSRPVAPFSRAFSGRVAPLASAGSTSASVVPTSYRNKQKRTASDGSGLLQRDRAEKHCAKQRGRPRCCTIDPMATQEKTAMMSSSTIATAGTHKAVNATSVKRSAVAVLFGKLSS